MDSRQIIRCSTTITAVTLGTAREIQFHTQMQEWAKIFAEDCRKRTESMKAIISFEIIMATGMMMKMSDESITTSVQIYELIFGVALNQIWLPLDKAGFLDRPDGLKPK